MSGDISIPTIIPRSSMNPCYFRSCLFYVYPHDSSPTGYIPLLESLMTLVSSTANLSLEINALKKNLDRTLNAFSFTDLRLLGKTYRRDRNASVPMKKNPDLKNQTFLSCTDFIALLRSKVPGCPREFYDSLLGLTNQPDFIEGYIQCHLTKVEWLKRSRNLQY